MDGILIELFKAFNHVKFNDHVHKYHAHGKELISVTTLIHKYQEEFNHQFWSKRKANEYNIEQVEVSNAWEFINKKATTKGSIVHNYAENLFNNKFFPYPKDMVLETFGYDPVHADFLKSKKQIDAFYRDTYNKLIPIKTEFVICDIELGIGGMIDLLVYNVKAGEFQLWDYKTNKALHETNERGTTLKGSLFMLPDCQMEIYSLQLGLYKKIIERNTNIKIGKCYLVWVSVLNDEYVIKETFNRDYYVDIMMNEYKNSNAVMSGQTV